MSASGHAPCGCFWSRSMFADDLLLSADPCYEHAKIVQMELRALMAGMRSAINADPDPTGRYKKDKDA